MRCSVLALLFGIPVLAGCAIHPQAEDLSNDALPDIVMKIRCEAKAAILELFPDEKDDLRWTSVALKFDFTMRENDNLTSNGTVKMPISFGTFTMGWDAGLKKERRVQQTFGIGDNFNRLAGLPCEKTTPGRNYLYPVTGNIGLGKTFETYARLVRQNQGAFKGEISEVIRFTTDWNGSLKPSWNLTPLSKQVIGINADATGQRSDIHQLTLDFKPLDKPLTAAQAKAKEAAEKEARKRELQRLAEEKALPTHFVLVDPDNRPVDPRTLFGAAPRPVSEGAPAPTDGAAPGAPVRGERAAPAARAPAPADEEKRLEAARKSAIDRAARSTTAPARAPATTQDSNDRRAYEQLQQNEALRTNQKILDELRARGAL